MQTASGIKSIVSRILAQGSKSQEASDERDMAPCEAKRGVADVNAKNAREAADAEPRSHVVDGTCFTRSHLGSPVCVCVFVCVCVCLCVCLCVCV